MTEPLQVGQFAIVDHEPVDRGPNAGMFHGKGPHDDRAELYAVAEGTTPAGESFAGHVVSAIGHSWQSHDMSLTGALGQVFREGERNLREWNTKSIAQHRVSLGLTCFARRGNQAVVAQAGPSVAFHLSGGKLHSYFPDEEHARPLGFGGTPNPQLNRITLASGDRLLLLSTIALRELDDGLIGGILALGSDKILPELYQRLKELRNVTVLLITEPPRLAAPVALAALAGDAEDVMIDATAARGDGDEQDDGFQASLFVEGKTEAEEAVELARRRLEEVDAAARVRVAVPAMAAEAPVPLRRASGETVLASLAERHARLSRGRASANVNAVAAAGPARQIVRPPSGQRGIAARVEDRERSRTASFGRGLVREEPPPPPPPVAFDPAPFVEDAARDIRARAVLQAPSAEVIAGGAMTSVSGGGTLVRRRATMGGRWKGGGGLSARPASTGGHVPGWAVLAVGIALLLLLVGIVTVPRLLNEEAADQYFALIDEAQQQLAAAGVQVDPAARRQALQEAQAALIEAQKSDQAGTEVQALMDSVQAALASMDAIVNPTAVETLADLSQFGQRPVTLSKIDVGPVNAYLLDPNSSQVIAVTLGSGETATVYAEDAANAQARPVALAQITDSSGALVVDSNNVLWTFVPGSGLTLTAFAAPEDATITDITVADGNLYALDSANAVIYRFQPVDGGFGVEPSEALASPDLANARRILVYGDEIVVSDQDGTLRWFSTESSLVLSQAGIDEPLLIAEPPQRFGGAGDIAVMDAPKNRIVVFRRDGSFLRQYQHADFEGLNAFAIGPGGDGYVFSGGQLRRVTW